ncbi:hemolysin family protein [Oenococcus alcoholitolerans]|uniref:hemolysin family protein n=1 Tax=Oenococcus alcoholitolerans TaxID=931074 RepID=UPI003F6E7D38
MDSDPSILVTSIALIVSLLLAVMFTLTEYSLIRSRPSALRAIEKDQKKPSRSIKLAIHMTENLNEYLSTAQTGITLTSLIIGWLGEDSASNVLRNSGIFSFFGRELEIAVSSIIGILLFTFVHAVFTDLVPKNIAIDEPVKVLLRIARPVRFFHIVLFPLIWLFDRTAASVSNLLGFKTATDEDIYSPTEIISLTKSSALASDSEVDEEDANFMQRAFEMNDKVASDVMVDRTSMVVVDVDDTIRDALNLYLKDQYSRFPVTADHDKDKILGYAYNYDIVRQARIDDKEKISTIMRDIVSVPENMKVPEVMVEMSTHRVPMAIVIDEYGGTSGIITDKDIYEELFGNIRDEQDDEDDEMIKKLGQSTYQVAGKISLYDLEDFFNTKIPEFDEDDAVTLTGFVQNNYPDTRRGDTISVENDDFKFEITANDYEDAYINFFTVKKIEKEYSPHGEMTERIAE